MKGAELTPQGWGAGGGGSRSGGAGGEQGGAHTQGSSLILSRAAVAGCVVYKQQIILKFKMNTYHSVPLSFKETLGDPQTAEWLEKHWPRK